MVDLAPLSPITTSATALSSLVLVSPQSVSGYQPQQPPNADGTLPGGSGFFSNLISGGGQKPSLLFHYEGEQTAVLESDITDHYVEDNIAVQDQIALKPETVTTHGFIGELNNVTPSFLKPLKFIANKLTAIGSYTPALTTTALIAYDQAFFLYQVASNAANSAISAWNTLTGQGGLSVIDSQGLSAQANQNKQQAMFQQFYGYWRNRTLFTVQTPWAIFQNMAIVRLRAIQDADTKVITDFEVSFKMIRTASTQTSNGTGYQSYAGAQASSLVDQGTTSPTPSTGIGEALGASIGGG